MGRKYFIHEDFEQFDGGVSRRIAKLLNFISKSEENSTAFKMSFEEIMRLIDSCRDNYIQSYRTRKYILTSEGFKYYILGIDKPNDSLFLDITNGNPSHFYENDYRKGSAVVFLSAYANDIYEEELDD